MDEIGGLAEFSKDGALREGHALARPMGRKPWNGVWWASESTDYLPTFCFPKVGPELVPHQQTGLQQKSSIKRDLLPNFKKGAS